MVVNKLNVKNDADKGDMCKSGYPLGLKDKCEAVASALKLNADLKLLLEHGCVDNTTPLQIPLAAGKCNGLVACNIIEDASGTPMCGHLLVSYCIYIYIYDMLDRTFFPSKAFIYVHYHNSLCIIMNLIV